MAKRIIISGGGTGGHIFPAIAIAQALKKEDTAVNILFVGAEGKMEMNQVPQAGFKIIGLPIRGLQRSFSPQSILKNIMAVFKLVQSLIKAKHLLKEHKPDIVVGVGGYASGAILYQAHRLKIPIVIQEQNSYAGITNKLLAKKASRIFTAYEGMEHTFPKKNIILTGNPTRENLNTTTNKEEALAHFNLTANNKTILVLGGSLGAKTINQAILKHIEALKNKKGVQILWQTGKLYYSQLKPEVEKQNASNMHITPFIKEMNYAYTLADVIISRAGAGAISELCVVAKPTILVPSPNVAEDHQTKNAQTLVKKNAALLITDKHAISQMIPTTLNLLENKDKCQTLKNNIKQLAKHNAAKNIALEILRLIKSKTKKQYN